MKTAKLAYKKLEACRINKDTNLSKVLDLGDQVLTGVFPRSIDEEVTSGPLELVWSSQSGLLQLGHSYDCTEMYGENYGYRSGLNQSMVDHLTLKACFLEKLTSLSQGDVVLDIGSNDGTTLKAYPKKGVKRIGIDPTGAKFSNFYPEGITLVPDFFSKKNYFQVTSNKAKIVTSISMFYDLEDPIHFAKEVFETLADDGVWHLEQSYMPTMLRLNAYDTICHEHLEYYSLGAIKNIMKAADLKIIDVSMNNINGGSFAVTVVKESCNKYLPNTPIIDWLLSQEDRMALDTLKPYQEFEKRVMKHRHSLINLIHSLVADGKKILGYGASTKGNVLLQFCGLTTKEIPAIADVNPDKFGCFTPGTHIPIISESEARAMKPDYFLVLPWHFKEGILRREKAFTQNNGKFIFPFPEIEIV